MIRNLVEYIGLGGGLIVALIGVWNSIRDRKREDKAAADKAGVDAVQTSKMVQDIAVDLQNTYLQRVQDNVALLEGELARTKRRLLEATEALEAKGVYLTPAEKGEKSDRSDSKG